MTTAHPPTPDTPIGVFDSGVGGLTVARRILSLLPNEQVVYIADQAHVPYGGRDLAEVRGFACSISDSLFAYGCKAVVMACNISSAVALQTVQATHPDLPSLGVILPGAAAAALATRQKRIGVLATAGTVKSTAYTRALCSIDPAITVTEIACPAFVPLVESGGEGSETARLAAEEYLAPLRQADVDTVILGCTHYPFLLPMLQSVWNFPAYIDPAEQTARELAGLLVDSRLSAPSSREPVCHQMLTTGDLTSFQAHVLRFLPDSGPAAHIQAVRWRDHMLDLQGSASRI